MLFSRRCTEEMDVSVLVLVLVSLSALALASVSASCSSDVRRWLLARRSWRQAVSVLADLGVSWLAAWQSTVVR